MKSDEFSGKMLDQAVERVHTAIVVQDPTMQRRTMATFRRMTGDNPRQHNLRQRIRQRIKQQHKKQIKNFKKPLTYHKIHGMILPVECGGIAQLARARGSYPRCRWFKSSSRYFEKGLYKPFFYFFKEQTDTGKLIIAKVTVVAARRVSGESSSVK